jgi:hypothetical protein
MQLMTIVAADAFKSLLLVYIRLGTRSHTQEGMSAPGNVTGHTYIQHVGCFIEIMSVGQSSSSGCRSYHMAIAAGTVAMGTIVVITLNLMSR